jgi:TolA-binding protein
MRCKKLRKKYFKYMDSRLSERKSRLLEEHIRDCPGCSAEADALERMRSSLREAYRIEVPGNYWDTYWDRLEAKLPDRPSPVTLRSRLTDSFSGLYRRPLILGRIVVYALLLMFVIYMAPDRMVNTPSEPLTPTLKSEMQEEKAFLSKQVERDIKAGDELRESDLADREAFYWRDRAEAKPSEPAGEVLDDLAMQPAEEIRAGAARPESLEPTKPADYNGVVVSAPAVPRRPVPTVEAPSVEAEASLRGFAGVEDEYTAAEHYFQEGQYVQAIPAYQNFIAANTIANVDDDRNLRAQYQIGEAYYQIGNYPEALSNFAAVTHGEVSEEEGRKAGTFDAERLSYKESAASSTELEKQHEVKARGEEETARGAVALDRVVRQNEGIPDEREEVISQAMFRLAQSYEKLGQREEAITAYNRYVERYPDDDQALKAQYQIGEVYYQMGNYSEALPNFAAVADADVSEERVRKAETFRARRVRARMEDKESAGLGVERAKAKDQEALKGVRVAAGRAGYAIRKDEEAPDNLEKLVSQAMFRLAESYEKLERREAAIAAYRKYVEKYPRGQYLPQAKEKIAQMKR